MNRKHILTVALFFVLLALKHFSEPGNLTVATLMLATAIGFGFALLASVRDLLEDIFDAPPVRRSSLS